MILRFQREKGLMLSQEHTFQAKPSNAQIYMGKVTSEIRNHSFSVKAGSLEITVEGTASS